MQTVISFLGLLQQITTSWWLKAQETYSLAVPETKNSETQMSAWSCCLWRFQGTIFSCLFLACTGGGKSLASLALAATLQFLPPFHIYIFPVCVCVCVCVCVQTHLCLEEHQSLDLVASLTHYDHILTWSYLQRPYFQIRSHSQLPGARTLQTYSQFSFVIMQKILFSKLKNKWSQRNTVTAISWGLTPVIGDYAPYNLLVTYVSDILYLKICVFTIFAYH